MATKTLLTRDFVHSATNYNYSNSAFSLGILYEIATSLLAFALLKKTATDHLFILMMIILFSTIGTTHYLNAIPSHFRLLRNRYLIMLKRYNEIIIFGLQEVICSAEINILNCGKLNYKSEWLKIRHPKFLTVHEDYILKDPTHSESIKDVTQYLNLLVQCRRQLDLIGVMVGSVNDIDPNNILTKIQIDRQPKIEELIAIGIISSSINQISDFKLKLLTNLEDRKCLNIEIDQKITAN